jgi:hypothetical protein
MEGDQMNQEVGKEKQDSILTSSALLPHKIRQRIVNKPDWFQSDDGGWMSIDLSSPPNLLALAQIAPDPTEKLTEGQLQEKRKFLADLSRHISDLTVDVFDVIMANWVEDDGLSMISIDDFLELRGLTRRADGSYDHRLREEIRLQLNILNNMWIRAEEVWLFREDSNGKVKKVFERIHGKLLTIAGVKERKVGDQEYLASAWYIQPGPPMLPYFKNPNKQLARMTKAVLEFHPINESIEKRIARHLIWHFRIRQAKGDYLRSFNNEKLLSAAAIIIDGRKPARSKERIETAWDRLVEKKIIRAWQYDTEWDETLVGKKGWAKRWLKANIIFEPTLDTEDYYRNIPKRLPEPAALLTKKESDNQNDPTAVIQALDAYRRQQNLSQLALAEKLGIATSYLSMILNNRRVPAEKLLEKIKALVNTKNP